MHSKTESDVVEFSLIDRGRATHRISAKVGRSLMENIRDAGFDELLALCGGSCVCATCHVYIDEAHFSRLPLSAEGENSLLDTSVLKSSNSRLACQVTVDQHLGGATVTIVPD